MTSFAAPLVRLLRTHECVCGGALKVVTGTRMRSGSHSWTHFKGRKTAGDKRRAAVTEDLTENRKT